MASPSADLIQDITTRFVLTAPAEQLMFFESIMFLVEQAHWYYEDYVRDQDSSLRSLGLKEFAVMVFENCPELSTHLDDIEAIMEHFKAFKKNVPVMGAILLDQDMQRVLLVKGWKNSACWGFPRGKIHKNETDAQCAVREVLEETGYDLEELVREEDFIELTLDGKRNKLYIVAGLDPNSAQFAPKCKGEIGGYAWHRIADLPATREEGNQTFMSDDGTKHKFFMVWPYLKPLRKWIRKQQRNNPEGLWDMPQPAPGAMMMMSTPPPQQQQQQYTYQQPQQQQQLQQSAGNNSSRKQQRNSNKAQQQEELWDMPLPLQAVNTTPQQQQQHMSPLVQQLAASERRSGGGGGGGSPKHTLHAAFHEAAIAQSRQTAAGITFGPNPVNATVHTPSATGVAAAVAAGASSSSSAPRPVPTAAKSGAAAAGGGAGGGALAKLFAGAAQKNPRAGGGSSSDSLMSCSPAGSASGGSGTGGFTFNRQQILTALTHPGAAGAAAGVQPLRHQISGRG